MGEANKYHKRSIKMATWGFLQDELEFQRYETGVDYTLSPALALLLRSHVSRCVEAESRMSLADMISEPSRSGRKFMRRLVDAARNDDETVLDQKHMDRVLEQFEGSELFPFTGA